MLGRHGVYVGIALGLCACGGSPASPADGSGGEGGEGEGGWGVVGSGGGTSTGTGGVPTTCGNGVVDAGEVCDTAGESATCDADCTSPACGDGVRNAAAGEDCDDGNSAEGDFCSAGCEPTEVLLEGPFQSSGAPGGTISVATTDGRFVAAWTKDEVGPAAEPLHYAAWEANGTPAIARQTLDGDATAGPIAVNGAGRLLATYWAGTAFSTQYRYASPGGALEGAAQSLSPGYVAGALGATGSGGFCLFGFDGQIRCTGPGDAFGGPIELVPVGSDSYPVTSAELVPAGQGLVAAYIVTSESAADPDELRMRSLDASGNAVSSESVISPVQPNTTLAGSVVRKDGGFAFGVASYDEVVLMPFGADGQLDGANVATLAQGIVGGRVVGHASGRFVLVYREIAAELDQNLGTVIETCSIRGRAFSETAQPLGEAFEIYEAPHGICAWPASVAVNDAGDLFAAWAQFVDGNSATATCQLSAKIMPGVLSP